VGFLFAADAYVAILPNEPILVAAVAVQRKRWLRLALWATLGSALGAASVAWLVSAGSGWIFSLFDADKLTHSHTWIETMKAVRRYGPWGLAVVSLSPLPHHPAIIAAGLVNMPAWHVFLAAAAGRAPKYIATAYLAAKAPEKLKRWHLIPKSAA
jgi:membrane protein YqaA with SNARE-associated domain